MPKLFDICSLYGHFNAAAVKELVERILQTQPKYMNDLLDAFPKIFETLDDLTVRVLVAQLQVRRILLQRRQSASNGDNDTDGAGGEDHEAAATLRSFDELVTYECDVITTLATFVFFCPRVVARLLSWGKNYEFLRLLVFIYDTAMPALRSVLDDGRHLKLADRAILSLLSAALEWKWFEPLFRGQLENEHRSKAIQQVCSFIASLQDTANEYLETKAGLRVSAENSTSTLTLHQVHSGRCLRAYQRRYDLQKTLKQLRSLDNEALYARSEAALPPPHATPLT